MPRKKKGGRRGPATWAVGSQFTFLDARKKDWIDNDDRKDRSKFYSDVAVLFVNKYGWSMQDNDEPDPDESDPASIHLELLAGVTDAEKKERIDTLAKLRCVS